MAGLERGARLLRAALVRRAARRGLPWLLILLLLLGSAARALGLPPPSYLSLKSNLLNV